VNIVAMEGRPQPKDSIVYVLNGQIAGGVVRFAKKQAGWYDVRMNVQGNGQSAGCLELLLASDMKGETWEFGTVQTYEEHGGGHKNLQRASAERLFKRSKKRGRIEQPCCDNTSTEVQPRVYTGASDVCAGEGLFAATNLQQGDVVVAMVSPTKVTREAGEAYMQRFGVPTDSVVDYERSGKVMTYYDESWTNADTRPYWHYLNHGRPGNTRPRVRANAYEWVASGPILAGEEMTFDYGEPDPSWSRDSSMHSNMHMHCRRGHGYQQRRECTDGTGGVMQQITPSSQELLAREREAKVGSVLDTVGVDCDSEAHSEPNGGVLSGERAGKDTLGLMLLWSELEAQEAAAGAQEAAAGAQEAAAGAQEAAAGAQGGWERPWESHTQSTTS
jgi:hypothetical protein